MNPFVEHDIFRVEPVPFAPADPMLSGYVADGQWLEWRTIPEVTVYSTVNDCLDGINGIEVPRDAICSIGDFDVEWERDVRATLKDMGVDIAEFDKRMLSHGWSDGMTFRSWGD